MLHPGARCDPIQCSLTIHSIDDVLTYSAISYEWGSLEAYRDTEVDGHLLQIMLNLHEFLLKLRDTHTTQILWADAVCINQRNEDERSHQLTSMARVYSDAEQVMAWLGAAAD